MSNDDLVKRYRALQEAIGGCGDGGCVIKRPQGQHTNGGCRCAYKPDHVTASRLGQIAGLAQKMADRIEALEKRVAKLEKAMAWRPIESAPRSNGSNPFLAHIPGHGCAVVFRNERDDNMYTLSGIKRIYRATHWMPLPAAPEGE